MVTHPAASDQPRALSVHLVTSNGFEALLTIDYGEELRPGSKKNSYNEVSTVQFKGEGENGGDTPQNPS